MAVVGSGLLACRRASARRGCQQFLILFFSSALALAQPERPFIIHVTDDQTGRGVPLVELRTLNEILFVTDSAGVAAITDPALTGRKVLFRVHAHGYEFPQKF